MTTTTIIIITFCILLLVAYLFDLTSSKTNIPSVILLLLLGWGLRQITNIMGINLPNFSILLPVLGTVGLILIVLEGSLELNFNKSKIKLITKSFLGALIPMLLTTILIALVFHIVGNYTIRESIINTIPLCIISSAIAIPSVKNLSPWKREFVIYESSFSDILGVLFFTFMTLNNVFSFSSFGRFGLQIFLMIIISLIATLGLAFLLSKIQHHIKFIPITLIIILIYSISEIYHLPALIFILLFGLFLGNINKIEQFKLKEKLHLADLEKEISKLKELTIEATFLVKTIFFLVFGYLMETSEILNPSTILWAIGIVVIIFCLRAIQLKLSKLPLRPLLFIAPRGLITILLFLSIDPSQKIMLVNKSLIIQVIILTSLIMMGGLLMAKNETATKNKEPEEFSSNTE